MSNVDDDRNIIFKYKSFLGGFLFHGNRIRPFDNPVNLIFSKLKIQIFSFYLELGESKPKDKIIQNNWSLS